MFNAEDHLEKANDIFEIVVKRHLLASHDFNLEKMGSVQKGFGIQDHILSSLSDTRLGNPYYYTCQNF